MLFRAFIWIIALSPLPFGANRSWSWSLYVLLLGGVGGIYFARRLFSLGRPDIAIIPLKYPICLATVPLVWAVFQLFSWCGSWTHPFWDIVSAQLSQPIEPRISLSPEKTATAWMKLASYFLVFFLSFQFNRRSDRAASTFDMLAYAGFVYALYGLYALWADDDTLFWFDNSAYRGNVRSTFVNRNSYATYAGLSLLALLPMLMARVRESLVYGVHSYFGLQFFIEKLLLRGWLPLLMCMTMCTALFLTHSRGGFLSTMLAIGVFFLSLYLSGRLKNGKAMVGLVLMMMLIALSFWSSSDKLLERLDRISLDERGGRMSVFAILERAISENLWLGVGYGSFAQSFRLYRDETVAGYYTAAHNTYLENLFELGLLPAAALFLSIAWLGFGCLRGVWRRQRNWHYPAIGFAATVLVGTHALVDFSLQIPAVAYTFALLLGAGYAQALPRHWRLETPSR